MHTVNCGAKPTIVEEHPEHDLELRELKNGRLLEWLGLGRRFDDLGGGSLSDE